MMFLLYDASSKNDSLARQAVQKSQGWQILKAMRSYRHLQHFGRYAETLLSS